MMSLDSTVPPTPAEQRRRRIAQLKEWIEQRRYEVDVDLLAERLLDAARQESRRPTGQPAHAPPSPVLSLASPPIPPSLATDSLERATPMSEILPDDQLSDAPLSDAPRADDGRPPAAATAPSARVLLVDDDPSVLRSLGRALTKVGHEVLTAVSGAEAIAALKDASFDVIISDVHMPQMRGTDLLRNVRALDADVPVLLLTGAPSVDTAIEAVELGAFRYLTKPVGTQALRDVVASASRVKRLSHLKRTARELLGQPSAPFDPVGLDVCLSRALDALWLATQPIVDSRTREVFAYEALMRTKEPTLPHPGAILDAAERLDRLGDVSHAVLTRAADALESAPSPVTLFVNLHPRDLCDARLFDAGAPLSRVADRVVLELTERASLDDIGDLEARVRGLRERGFRIAIDDLGAGYASLKAFVDLKPEFVKIDMGLVRGIDASDARRRVVGSLTELCHDLGATVVAEGIETAAERDTLVELGCDLLQGYWFARPGAGFPAGRWEGAGA